MSLFLVFVLQCAIILATILHAWTSYQNLVIFIITTIFGYADLLQAFKPIIMLVLYLGVWYVYMVLTLIWQDFRRCYTTSTSVECTYFFDKMLIFQKLIARIITPWKKSISARKLVETSKCYKSSLFSTSRLSTMPFHIPNKWGWGQQLNFWRLQRT